MTTDLALHDSAATGMDLSASAFNPAVASLVEWAHSAKAANTIAQSLVTTSFVPEAFRGKANEATAAILAGAEVGLSPMAALRSFDVIQGVAAPRANTLRAVVQSQGHDVWVVESTETRAVVDGQRRGSSRVQRSVWSIDRAAKLKLTGKSNWQNQPQAMLVARATAECCRLVASDAILGLSAYSVEELVDGDDAASESTTTVSRPRRTARRAPLVPVADEPTLDPDPDSLDAAEAATDQGDDTDGDASDLTISDAQLTKLNIQLQENGYGDREEKLRYLTLTLGREIGSSKDLTRSEAHRLIEAFEQGVEIAEPPLDEA